MPESSGLADQASAAAAAQLSRGPAFSKRKGLRVNLKLPRAAFLQVIIVNPSMYFIGTLQKEVLVGSGSVRIVGVSGFAIQALRLQY